MRSSSAVAQLLLASSAYAALPYVSVAKRDKHTFGQSDKVARGLVKRQGTLQTNVFDIITYSTGGAYYANITVGNPPQEQTVILDTGSSDLYFDASTAKTCQTPGPNTCRDGTFTPANSHDYKIIAPSPAFNTSFGDGSTASGPFASDMVCLSDICIDNVQFGVAEEVDSTTGYSLGLMGVGYSLNEATEHLYPNMPEVLKDAGVINSRLYSLMLNDEGDTSGSILFGGIDTSKYQGTLQTVDMLPALIQGQLTKIYQFITAVTGLETQVSGQTQTIFSGGQGGLAVYNEDSVSQAVLLDSGSSAWTVTQELYDNILEEFSYVDARSGTCSCEYRTSTDRITVQFEGEISITVPAQEFIVPIYNATTNQPVALDSNNDLCAFMIQPGPSTGQGFLTCGDAVMRSMYIVYDLDNGQMSLAQAKINSTAPSNIVTVNAGPSGIQNAVSGVSAAPMQSFPIAKAVNGTVKFPYSTVSSTINTATGIAAVPTDAQPSGDTGSSSGGGSSGSSSAAAAGLTIPGADWSGVWVMGVSIFMAALGAGLML